MDNMKDYIGESCFTACIKKALWIQGYDIEEEMIFCGRDMLTLECETKYDAVFTSALRLNNIKASCEKHGIKITKLEELNEDSLKKYIDMYGNIILHLDCRFLTYARVFRNTTTRQCYHYINIFKYEDNRFLVSDSYIPEASTKSYYGWMTFDELLYETCSAYIVETQEVIPWTDSEIKGAVRESLHNYFYKSHSQNTFDKFIENVKNLKSLEDEKKIKDVLLEMAAAIGVNGARQARKCFNNLRKRCGLFSEKNLEIDNSFNDLIKDYVILRVLLLKAMFALNEENLKWVINKIENIKTSEYKLFKTLEGGSKYDEGV